MPKLAIHVGTTSKLVHFYVQKISDSRPFTGLTNLSSGLTAYYMIEGAATAVAISLSAGTVGTWSSGGFKEVDATNFPGLYELGLPNLSVASGKSVKVMLKGVSDMFEAIAEIELEQIDNQDSVRAGLTALPNVAAGANGGLPLGDASGRTTVGSIASGAITATAIAADAITAAKVADGTIDAATFAAGAINAAAIAADAITAAKVADGTIDAATFSAGAINAAAIASNAITSAKVATDAIGAAQLAADAVTKIQTAVAAGAVASVTGAVGSVTGNVGGNVTGSVGSVVGAVGSVTAGVTLAASAVTAIWDKATSALTTVGSIGKFIVDGSAPSAATIAAAVWDRLTSALTAVGSIGKLLVDDIDIVLSTRSSASALATAQTAITDLQSRTPAALVSGRMDASVGAMAADVITASALSAGAVDEILDDTIGDSTITVRQALRVLLAGMAGKLSGAATTTVTIRNVADSADVILATVDATGNRTAVTVTP